MSEEKKLSICSEFAGFCNRRQIPDPFRYASFSLWCSFNHKELKTEEIKSCHDFLVRNFSAETNVPVGSFDPWID